MKCTTTPCRAKPHRGALILGILILAVGFGCTADKTKESGDSGEPTANDVSDTTTKPGNDAHGDVIGSHDMKSSDGKDSAITADAKTDQNTSPPSPDTGVDAEDEDGDGLSNEHEATLGTDPGNPDTDGDGYIDGHEVAAGTDPLDKDDVIYKGGWPFNPDKDSETSPPWTSEPAVGAKIPRFQAYDQYGDLVDLYDFMHQGKPIVLDLGTWFCKPCKGLADWFATDDITAMNPYLWFAKKGEGGVLVGEGDDSIWGCLVDTDCNDGEYCYIGTTDEDGVGACKTHKYGIVRELIEEEKVIWITVLWTGNLKEPVNQESVAAWHEAFPNHHIVVLADTDRVLKEYLKVVAMPHIAILNENLEFTVYDVGGPTPGFKHLLTME